MREQQFIQRLHAQDSCPFNFEIDEFLDGKINRDNVGIQNVEQLPQSTSIILEVRLIGKYLCKHSTTIPQPVKEN